MRSNKTPYVYPVYTDRFSDQYSGRPLQAHACQQLHVKITLYTFIDCAGR